jgi:hypothetical protein
MVEKYGLNGSELDESIKSLSIKIAKEVKAIQEIHKESPLQNFKSDSKFWTINPKNPKSKYVVCTMDKFQDRFVIICKMFYCNWIFEELASDSFEKVDASSKSIIAQINADAALFQVVNADQYDPPLEEGQRRSRGQTNFEPSSLAQPYIQPKLHKPTGVGVRIVSGGTNLPTTPISAVLARCLKLLLPMFDAMWLNLSITSCGLAMPRCSIMRTSDDLTQRIQRLNALGELGIINLAGGSLGCYDFTKLYPTLPQEDLIRRVLEMIDVGMAYKLAQIRRKKPNVTKIFIIAKQHPSRDPAKWSETDEKGTDEITLDTKKIKELLRYLINNSYVQFGALKEVYKIVRGIPTGTNAAPDITNIYLLYYEMRYAMHHFPKWKSLDAGTKCLLLSFCRYIDDCFVAMPKHFSVKNFLYFSDKNPYGGLYPSYLKESDGKIIKLPLELIGEEGDQVACLDLHPSINVKGKITYTLYDKREHLMVAGKLLSELRNFPHIDTAITESQKYSTLNGELHRVCRRESRARTFKKRIVKYSKKLIKEGYDPKKVRRKIICFRGWEPSLGKWKFTLRSILKELRAY